MDLHKGWFRQSCRHCSFVLSLNSARIFSEIMESFIFLVVASLVSQTRQFSSSHFIHFYSKLNYPAGHGKDIFLHRPFIN
jgi:hypothetical protein